MTVTLLQFGETRDKHVCALCEDFERRLSSRWQMVRRVLRPCRLSDDPSEAEIRAALEKESAELLSVLESHRRALKVALCVEGREVTSNELAALMGENMQTHGEFVFIIGSSYGLSETVKRACDVRLSLSRLTLPHELCRLVFTEQLYRAYTILNSMKYHK